MLVLCNGVEDLLAHLCIESYVFHACNVSFGQLCWLKLLEACQVDPREHSQLSIAHLSEVNAAHALAFIRKGLLELRNNSRALGALYEVD